MTKSLDSFNCRRALQVGDAEYVYFDLKEAEKNGLEGISRLPFSMKVLLENLLRNEDGRSVTKSDIEAVAVLPRDSMSLAVPTIARPEKEAPSSSGWW